MSSDAPRLPEPAAAARPGAVERIFPYAWMCFQLVVWAWAAVWWEPRLLEFVGGRSAGDWLARHLWVRLLFTPILVPLLVISAFHPLKGSGRRLTPAELADPDGAAPTDATGMDLADGFPVGHATRVPLGPWVMDIGTWSRKGGKRTVARVRVDVTSPLSFVARSARSEPALLRGVQQAAMSYAIRRAAEAHPDARAAGIEATMAYLGEAPLPTGDATLDRTVVLRANHPDAARALLRAAPVASALAALERLERGWEWTFYPTTDPGRAEMTLECPGSMQKNDRAGLVHALMSAALDHLASTGAIRSAADRAA